MLIGPIVIEIAAGVNILALFLRYRKTNDGFLLAGIAARSQMIFVMLVHETPSPEAFLLSIAAILFIDGLISLMRTRIVG